MFNRREFFKLCGATTWLNLLPGWLTGRARGDAPDLKPTAAGWSVPMTVAADLGLRDTLRARVWLPLVTGRLANRD